MTASVVGRDVIGLARGLRTVVGAEAAESERLRTMSPPIVEALWASGLMTAFNPREAGGVEPSFAEMIETWIEMAWQDQVPFEALQLQFGLSEAAVITLMRAELKRGSFRLWRARVTGRRSKHQSLRCA